MIEFIRRFLRNSTLSKEFEISAQKIWEYVLVRDSLDKIEWYLNRKVELGINHEFYTFKGEELKIIEREIPVPYRWTDTNIKEKNYILPERAAKFFLNGGTFREILDYECVSNYKMLAGKRRHLRIIDAII